MSLVLHHDDCLNILPKLDPNSVHSVVTDLAAGIAAEHLVCADLLLQGQRAFLADQNCPYDVASENAGSLIRIQVKSTRNLRKVPQQHYHAYMWHVRRSGKKGKRLYTNGEFDIMALVALDIRVIAYLPFYSISHNVIHLRAPGRPATRPNRQHRCVNEYPFMEAVSLLHVD